MTVSRDILNSDTPALDALIAMLAEDNKAVYVKRTKAGTKYIHCVCSIITNKNQDGEDYETIIMDATEETGKMNALRLIQPTYKDGKDILTTVARVYGMNLKKVPSLDDDEDENEG